VTSCTSPRRRISPLAVLVALCGCTSSPAPGDGGAADFSRNQQPADLAVARPDLTTPPDLAQPGNPSAGAMFFCDGHKAICGFGGPGLYPDYLTCERDYDSYSLTREGCVADELGLAGADPSHCAAAAGNPPCDKN